MASAAAIRAESCATLSAIGREVAEIARAAHARVMATDPRPAAFTQYVDGVLGAPLEKVKPNGIIVFRYSRVREIVEYALEVLRQKSPVLTGTFRDSFEVEMNGGGAIIYNRASWDRKIELGKMRMKVPCSDHVYAQAEQLLVRKYGNVVNIKLEIGGPKAPRAPALIIRELQ